MLKTLRFIYKKRFLGRLAVILKEFWSENRKVHQYGLTEGHFLGIWLKNWRPSLPKKKKEKLIIEFVIFI